MRVSAREDLADPGLGPLPLADEGERAGDRPDHIVQEAVGLDLDRHRLAFATGRDVEDRPDAAGPVGPVRLEAAEVVTAAEGLSGALHGVDVERLEDVPGVAAAERVAEAGRCR